MALKKLRKPLGGIKDKRSSPRIPANPKLALRPTGEAELKAGLKAVVHMTGPGEPPEGFVGVWTSLTEWYVYWALVRITAPSDDPRTPPFIGNEHFVYQKQEKGGRVPGGSVTDFAVSTPTGWIGIRVETERWHIWTTAAIQMKDLQIRTNLDSMERVIAVYDQHFIGDETGEEVIRVMKLALKGIELPSPIKFGTAQRIR